MMRVKPVKT